MTGDALPGAPLDAAGLDAIETRARMHYPQAIRDDIVEDVRALTDALRAAWREQTRRARTAQRLRDLRECLEQQTGVAALWEGSYREAIAERDELRAVLAPLLDDPWRDDGERYGRCAFCDKSPVADLRNRHEPSCPVLRRAALLGRRDDAAPGDYRAARGCSPPPPGTPPPEERIRRMRGAARPPEVGA